MIGVIGEALIDLVISPAGAISPHLGGGPYNTARALGRLGVPTTFLGRLSTDEFGTQLTDELAACRVTARGERCREPTTLALARLDATGKATYQFYFEGTSAPGLTPAALSASLPADLAALHVGTLGLILEPMAEATAQALRGSTAALRMVDPNVRPLVIANHDRYVARLREIVADCDVVKISDDDLAWISRDVTPVAAARAMLQLGPRVVFLTLGSAGTLVIGDDFEVTVPAPFVTVADTVGAGDSFSAGVLAWWWEHGRPSLAERDTAVEAARFGVAVAAKTVQRTGADPPWRHELEPAS